MVKYFLGALVILNIVFLSACLKKLALQKQIATASFYGKGEPNDLLQQNYLHFKDMDNQYNNFLVVTSDVGIQPEHLYPNDLVKITGNFDTLQISEERIYIQIRNPKLSK